MRAPLVAVAVMVFALPFVATTSAAQERVLTGRITDSSGAPVPLFHVFTSTRTGTPLGGSATLTDVNGRYRLRVASDSLFITVRRIGYRPELPQRVVWGAREATEVNWVVRTLPQALATVRVGSGTCRALNEIDPGTAARMAWDGAVESIRARQTFLDLYEYEERVVRQETKTGQPARVTMDSTNLVSPPQPDLDPSFRRDPLGKIYVDAQRRRVTSLWAPTDRALVDSVFVSRFCFDDALTSGADDFIQLAFREVGRARGDVTAKGTLRFRPDVPGLATVLFTYESNGTLIGRGSVSFTMIPVEGTTFPLETSAFLELVDASGKVVMSRASTTHTYAKFRRVQ